MLERDSRLWALGFEHRLHRQVSSLRVFGEVLLWPELVLQSLGEVPHLFPRGRLRRDLGGDVSEEGGGGDEGRRSGWEERQITKNFPKNHPFPDHHSLLQRLHSASFQLKMTSYFLSLPCHSLSAALAVSALLIVQHSRLTFSGKLSRANIKYCPAGNKKSSLR